MVKLDESERDFMFEIVKYAYEKFHIIVGMLNTSFDRGRRNHEYDSL